MRTYFYKDSFHIYRKSLQPEIGLKVEPEIRLKVEPE